MNLPVDDARSREPRSFTSSLDFAYRANGTATLRRLLSNGDDFANTARETNVKKATLEGWVQKYRSLIFRNLRYGTLLLVRKNTPQTMALPTRLVPVEPLPIPIVWRPAPQNISNVSFGVLATFRQRTLQQLRVFFAPTTSLQYYNETVEPSSAARTRVEEYAELGVFAKVTIGWSASTLYSLSEHGKKDWGLALNPLQQSDDASKHLSLHALTNQRLGQWHEIMATLIVYGNGCAATNSPDSTGDIDTREKIERFKDALTVLDNLLANVMPKTKQESPAHDLREYFSETFKKPYVIEGRTVDLPNDRCVRRFRTNPTLIGEDGTEGHDVLQMHPDTFEQRYPERFPWNVSLALADVIPNNQARDSRDGVDSLR